MIQKTVRRMRPWILVILVLVAWHVVVEFEIFSPYILPSLEKVVKSFLQMLLILPSVLVVY